MSQTKTYLFHDYETWGTNSAQDYPCQFAAIRTDDNFQPVGEPVNIMCRIPNDYLPSPIACLVTGITPQQSLTKGLTEAEFAARIYAEMSVPNTCSLGYNSIRFDDEVSRHLFYRNFYDPYAREWQNGNTRWDIIDVARACYALRPDGIEWPLTEAGTPVFKLEALSQANDIAHQDAHDALSDVLATIELAKLLFKAQPKLFGYALTLKEKFAVWQQIKLDKFTPLLHISSKIPASQGCCTYVLPVGVHPHQPNAVICVDLSKDVSMLEELSADEIRARLYAPAKVLPNPSDRPGLKLIHVNRSPFIASAKSLSPDRAAEIGVDRELCLNHYKQLINQPAVINKLLEIYQALPDDSEKDAEQALYSGGFLNNEEKRWCELVRTADPNHLLDLQNKSQNVRLKTLLMRYRARNYPETLSYDETVQWQQHRQARLQDGINSYSLTHFLAELENLSEQHQHQPKSLQIIRSLYQYAQSL